MGAHPSGYINYGSDGRMIVMIVGSDRKKPAGPIATPDEAQALIPGPAGTRSLVGDESACNFSASLFGSERPGVSGTQTWTPNRANILSVCLFCNTIRSCGRKDFMADREGVLLEGLIEANKALIALGVTDRRDPDPATSETVRTCLLMYSNLIAFQQENELSQVQEIQLKSVLDRLKKELRLYAQDV